MIYLLIAMLYIGLMIYLANLEQVRGESHPLLTAMQYSLVLIVGVWILNALTFVVITPEQIEDPLVAQQVESIDRTAAIAFVTFGLVGIVAIIALIRSPLPHRWIEQYIYGNSTNDRAYDSSLSVHKLAVMLMIVQVIAIVWTLLISGGVTGLDLSYDTPWQALGDLASSALLYIVLALLGVGWLIRRDTLETLKRLDLRLPTRRDITYGVGMALLLYVMLIIASSIWTSMVTSDVLEQQTAASQQLFEAFNSSLLLGFLLALLTGISEEILFRGALQPVFGLLPTSIFFTIIHIQYALTPATIILFIVALGFGWLRLRIGTTASIIAHITYNFIPFLLFTLATNAGAL